MHDDRAILLQTAYVCRRKAAKSPSSRRAPFPVASMTSCSLHPSHRRRRSLVVGRRPVNLILAHSFIRYVCTCITMIVRATKKKLETFETSFSQTSRSDNGVKKTWPVECTACDVEVSKWSTQL